MPQMSNRTKEEYVKVNNAWPTELPALTDWEAVRAAARLYRWARGAACPMEIRATSGNRATWARGGVLFVNPDKGWRTFVHDLSHYLDLERKPHSLHHAKLERRMIEQVIERQWLDGKLKVEAQPEPTLDVKRTKELANIEALIKRWQSKARRAENALKKLAKRRKYYERLAS